MRFWGGVGVFGVGLLGESASPYSDLHCGDMKCDAYSQSRICCSVSSSVSLSAFWAIVIFGSGRGPRAAVHESFGG